MKVLDVFCGAGGLSLGFKQAGFEIAGGIDFDEDAIATHERNLGDKLSFCGDITTLTDDFIKSVWGDVDVIVGGPPCQGFSVANLTQSEIEKDEKNKLFFEFIRFVKLIKPKAFVMENVRQILTKNKGFVKNTMLNVMDDLGYTMSVDVLKASDYGVPQKRVRAFFIGIRNDCEKLFIFDNIKKQSKVTIRDAICDLYYLDKTEEQTTVDDIFDLKSQPLTEYQKLMRKDSNNKLYNHNIRYPSEKVKARISHVPEGGNWKYVPEELWDTIRTNRHSNSYQRFDSQDVAPTIDTGHGNCFHPKYDRNPSVRECARLQSFPDDFVFEGKQGSAMRQVGNAVPPLLAKAIATELMRLLK